MGKQHNKVEKRRRRQQYLKRKKEAVKAQIALSKKAPKKKAAKPEDSVFERGMEAAMVSITENQYGMPISDLMETVEDEDDSLRLAELLESGLDLAAAGEMADLGGALKTPQRQGSRRQL